MPCCEQHSGSTCRLNGSPRRPDGSDRLGRRALISAFPYYALWNASAIVALTVVAGKGKMSHIIRPVSARLAHPLTSDSIGWDAWELGRAETEFRMLRGDLR